MGAVSNLIIYWRKLVNPCFLWETTSCDIQTAFSLTAFSLMSLPTRPALRINTINSPPDENQEAEDSLRPNDDDSRADYLRFINLLSGRNVPIIRISDLISLNSNVDLEQWLKLNARTSV